MSTQFTPPSLTDIESALYCVSPDINRDEWAKVGMALSSELGESGFDLFNQWSSRGDSYKASDTKATWRSVSRGSGIRINTLFYLARQNGYTGDTAGQITQQEAAERKQIRQQQEEQKRLRERYKGERNRKALRKVWSGCTPLNYCDDTPAHRYLINRLAGHPPPPLSDDLLFHPELEYWSDGIVTRHPALLAMVRNQRGEPITLHRTYLTDNGEKAGLSTPRKLMSPSFGKSVTGGAILLTRAQRGEVVVGEGIETALALGMALELPAFATISAHGLRHFEPPEGITSLIIAVDNDRSGTGQQAASDLSARIINTNPMQVQRMIPDQPGTDWCDFINRKEVNYG